MTYEIGDVCVRLDQIAAIGEYNAVTMRKIYVDVFLLGGTKCTAVFRALENEQPVDSSINDIFRDRVIEEIKQFKEAFIKWNSGK